MNARRSTSPASGSRAIRICVGSCWPRTGSAIRFERITSSPWSIMAFEADEGDAMTPKERALGLIENLPDDAGLEQICRRLYEHREIERSLAEADRDEGTEQDEFF